MQAREFAGKRVAVWGLGREGLGAIGWLRRHHPSLAIAAIEETPTADSAARVAPFGGVRLVTELRGGEALREFDVVVRSPGVSHIREECVRAAEAGVRFVSPTTLWFAAHPDATTVCITGTKGKSTTSSLTAAIVQAGGQVSALRGNIGAALLTAEDAEQTLNPRGRGTPRPDVWVIELSSAQCADLEGRPTVALATSLYPEHLDWHGSYERYKADKLRLLGLASGARLVNGQHGPLMDATAWVEGRSTYGVAPGICVAGGAFWFGESRLFDVEPFPLRGAHNIVNCCGAMAAAMAVGINPADAEAAVRAFRPLPHRLEPVGVVGGVTYVNDSIATNPNAALAALDAFAGQPVTLLLGGYDRGVPWDEASAAMVQRGNLHAVVTMPVNGETIAASLHRAAAEAGVVRGVRVLRAADLAGAVEVARRETPSGGVVLLAPGAASYHAFRGFEHRGEVFRELVLGMGASRPA